MAQWLHQIAEWLRCWSETIEHVTVAAASVIGGVWSYSVSSMNALSSQPLRSALTLPHRF